MGGVGDFLGNVLGPVVGGLFGMEGQKEANKINKQLGYDQMGWQQMMSNTAHTREVGDLKNAGLNPILSVNAGSSTPPGALPQVKNEMEGLQSSAVEAMHLALAAKKQKAEIGAIDASTQKTNTENTLLQKGIPKAEMENDFMRQVQQLYHKGKKALQSVPLSIPEYRERQKSNTPKGGLR